MQYVLWIQQLSQLLKKMDHWLDKAEAFAQERKFDVNTLLVARLAPDQFTLCRQIQSACDNVKLAASRLSKTPAPRHEDNETSVAELRARIASTLEFVSQIPAEAFDGADAVQVSFPWMPDMHLMGGDYFLQFAVPNFHFHFTTAYAILRHNGVPLGKQDYLASLSMQPGAAQNPS